MFSIICILNKWIWSSIVKVMNKTLGLRVDLGRQGWYKIFKENGLRFDRIYGTTQHKSYGRQMELSIIVNIFAIQCQ